MKIKKKTYGLLDTKDKLWMGDDQGPKLYSDFMVALIAAQMIDEQLEQTPGRTRAKVFKPGALRLVDDVPVKKTALRALQILEGGKE